MFHPSKRPLLMCREKFIPGSLGRGPIGINRLLPQPEPGKDVGGHMQRVRSRRRNTRITMGRITATLGNGRVVIAMNEVMRHTRMLWLLRKHFL
jgi:hypothetical protein